MREVKRVQAVQVHRVAGGGQRDGSRAHQVHLVGDLQTATLA